MNVAFYGGSFDPPHVGHVLAAAYLTAVGFDRVLVVPVFNHAFDKKLADFQQRVSLCRLAFATLSGVEVSTLEGELAAPSYTITSVLAVMHEHPEWRVRVVVGADVLPEIERWHRIDELQRLAPLYVLGRRGFEALPDAPVSVLPDVSSTKIRNLCALPASKQRDTELEQLVPKPVLEAIRQWHLYRAT